MKPHDASSPWASNDDVFEIVDFSVSGEFERIVHSLERVVAGERLSIQVPIADRVATISRVSRSADLPCANWAGIDPSVIVTLLVVPDDTKSPRTPREQSHSSTAALTQVLNFTWDQEKLIMSAAQIALRSSSINAAVFIAISSAWRKIYTGLMMAHSIPLSLDLNEPSGDLVMQAAFYQHDHPSSDTIWAIGDDGSDSIDNLVQNYALDSIPVETRFRMMHSPFIPSEYANLNGLRQLYCDRSRYGLTGAKSGSTTENLRATGTFTYSVDFAKSQRSTYFAPTSKMESSSFAIPFGPSTDPIASIYLQIQFSDEYCSAHLDNNVPLLPNTSEQWALHVIFKPEISRQSGCLHCVISGFLETNLSNGLASSEANSWHQEPHRKSNPASKKSLISRLAVAAANTIQDSVPASTIAPKPSVNLLNPMSSFAVSAAFDRIFASHENGAEKSNSATASLRTIHALSRARTPTCAPFDSLIWRLCSYIISSAASSSSTRVSRSSMASAWSAFVRALRLRWEACKLPEIQNELAGLGSDVEDSGVDLRDGLLTQKISMLGYCMKRRRAYYFQTRDSEVHRKVSEGSGLGGNPDDIDDRNEFDIGIKLESVSVVNGNDESLLSMGTRFFNAAINAAVGESLVETSENRGETKTDLDTIAIPGSKQLSHIQIQQQNVRFGESWNSDRSWEDFSASSRINRTARKRNGAPVEKQSMNEDVDELATEFYENQSVTGSATGDSELFFDSLEFNENSKPVATPLEIPPKQPSPLPAFALAVANNNQALPQSSPSKNLKHYSASSIVSNDSSGFLVSSFSPNGNIDNGTVRVSSVVGESYVKLPLDLLLVREQDTDKYVSYEIQDENVSEGGMGLSSSGLKIFATDALMVIPELQESGVMTEDMIAEQENMFITLGTSKEAAAVRARMQTGQLKSDMEAFKAANPKACLEDFVRWHSPRDWLVDDSTPNGGKLSARMKEPGNIWQEVWASARRIPARRQKPLFDFEKEGEKVLLFLEDLPRQNGGRNLFHLLLPTFFYVAYDVISKNPLVSQIPVITRNLTELTEKIVNVDWTHLDDLDFLLVDLLNSMNSLEYQLSVAKSLLYKLPLQNSLVDRILSSEGLFMCMLESDSERNAVCDFLNDEGLTMEEPTKREFILNSEVSMRRMFASLKDGDFRIFETFVYKD
ncbi:hypothetical protein HDU82_005196 [Entophlyctis luteolus]|nr:hypothetical protein HDU82_005196 [Entophlyctis luteolus]